MPAQNFLGIGLYTALSWTREEMEAANPSKIMQAHGLSKAEIENEMMLLDNALDYYNQTHRIDVAYDGFFFEKDLNTTRQIVEYTKPVGVASARNPYVLTGTYVLLAVPLHFPPLLTRPVAADRNSGLSTLSCSTRGRHGWQLSTFRPTRSRGGSQPRRPMYSRIGSAKSL